jgi:outer membrane protein TolC
VDAARLRENVVRHVELAAFEPMVRMATAEVREAQAGKKGDWGWEVAYQKRGSEFSDMVSVQLSFELPLFAAKRQDPQIYAKRKEIARIEAERDEKLRERLQDIEGQLAQQEELTRRLTRLRETALPLADERVRLTMASYQAGRSDLNAVLVARRDRIETRFNVIQTEAQLAALRAQLAYLFTEDRP